MNTETIEPSIATILALEVWDNYPNLQTSERLDIAREVFGGLIGFARHGWISVEENSNVHKVLVDAAKAIGMDFTAGTEFEKFKAHSVLLNQVLWKMLERLGHVGAEDSEHFGDAQETIDNYFSMQDNL